MNILRARDPLVVHHYGPDSEVKAKTPELLAGIEAVKHHVFRPSTLSFRRISGGNMQTLLTPLKDYFRHRWLGPFVYDNREVFTLSDGGEIYIEYLGKCFTEEGGPERPILFIVPGLTSHG